MLNKEKYSEQLVELALNGAKVAVVNDIPCACSHSRVPCDKCDLHSQNGCSKALLAWANSECSEPEVDWSKVQVDTPIIVCGANGRNWSKRHFSHYDGKVVWAFALGKTSWTTDAKDVTPWYYAKLAKGGDE